LAKRAERWLRGRKRRRTTVCADECRIGGRRGPDPVHGRDAADLSFRDRSFDAVVSMHALHHIRDLDGVLNELVRVLRPAAKWSWPISAHPGSVFLTDSSKRRAGA
jgi:SAM-dependent methyltransferase